MTPWVDYDAYHRHFDTRLRDIGRARAKEGRAQAVRSLVVVVIVSAFLWYFIISSIVSMVVR